MRTLNKNQQYSPSAKIDRQMNSFAIAPSLCIIDDHYLVDYGDWGKKNMNEKMIAKPPILLGNKEIPLIYKKINKSSLSISFGVFLVWLLLSMGSLALYPGDAFIFIGFCIASLVMFGVGWFAGKSYFYIFLAVFWLLGFWLKAVLHLIFSYDFVEPVGNFNGSAMTWDNVISVATVAIFALVLSRIIFILIFKTNDIQQMLVTHPKIPSFYKKHSKIVWWITIAIIFVIAELNAIFGLNQIGIVARYTLPFKLNIINAWVLDTGFVFWLAILLWWDFKLGKKIWLPLSIVILSGLLISYSLLSRGYFIYQAGSFLLPFATLRKNLRISYHLALVGLLFLVGILLTVHFVMQARDSIYPLDHRPNTDAVYVATDDISSSGKGNIFVKLAVDRWVGLEGVMAVSSWPNLGKDLFFKAWSENAKNKDPLYTTVCNATSYLKRNHDNKEKFSFASLPGIVAMLFYSGSQWLVFAAVFLLSFFMFLSEKFLTKLFGNPFVNSFYGMYSAVLISMCASGYLLAVQFLEIWLGFLILWFFIQRNKRFESSIVIQKQTQKQSNFTLPVGRG